MENKKQKDNFQLKVFLQNFVDYCSIIIKQNWFILIISWLVFLGMFIGLIAMLTASPVSWGGAATLMAFTIISAFETVWFTLRARK